MEGRKNKIDVSTQVEFSTNKCLTVEKSACLPVTGAVESTLSSFVDKKLDGIIEHLNVALANNLTKNVTYLEDKVQQILKGGKEVSNISQSTRTLTYHVH